MFALKKFLKHRDSRAAFDRIKKMGAVGIPCIVVDGEEFYFEDQIEQVHKLIVEHLIKNNKQNTRIDDVCGSGPVKIG